MARPKTIASKDLKAFLETKKRDSRLMGHIERHVLSKPFDERSQDHIHPSDIIKPDWCAFAQYHALLGNYQETRDKTSARLASIFAEGHIIHAKWQDWLREMGVLYGKWNTGKKSKWDISAKVTKSARYAEVPLTSAKHMMSGHADGWVRGIGEDFLIEIKSIGSGTLRFEAPALLSQAEDNIEKAWKNIRTPFRAHQLQGQVYLHLCHLMVEEGLLDTAPKEIVFIYELKANQDYKEFVVAYNPEFTVEIFDKALDVVWAVNNKRPPVCSIDPLNGCKRCSPFRSENVN